MSEPTPKSGVLRLIQQVSNAAARGERLVLVETHGLSSLSPKTIRQTLVFCRQPAVKAVLHRLPPRAHESQLEFLRRLLAEGDVPAEALRRYPGFYSIDALRSAALRAEGRAEAISTEAVAQASPLHER